jgi:tetratricopeptide (TPR) repeat protein
LVNPKENWPPVGKIGIYMTVVQQSECSTPTKTLADKSGIYFTFEHDSSYRQLQQKFLQAVETMDSDNIVRIINQQSYHIDSLIQLSELCKISEDHSMASQLIEHALYALESAFHSMFSLTQGTCRLDYRRQENRALFVVLFKHAQYLEARACSRTAQEITKLLLTLDESDPLAVKLVIDYYAIRSKQYDWLVDFYNEFEATNNLSQLPNMAYSYAMSLFYLKRMDEADKALQYALAMFPGVLKMLLDEISVQVDERCSTHKFFSTTAYTNQSLGLQQLTSLYVSRSKLVWRDSALLPWLERNVTAVLDKVDAKDEMFNDYAAKRNQRWVESWALLKKL